MEKSGAVTSFSNTAAGAMRRRERIKNLVEEKALTDLEPLFKEAAAALVAGSSGVIDLSSISEKVGGEQFVLRRTGLVDPGEVKEIDPALRHYFHLEVLKELFEAIQKEQKQPETVDHRAIAQNLVKIDLPFLEVLDLVAQGDGCKEGEAVSLRAIKEALEEQDLNGAYVRAVMVVRPNNLFLHHYDVAHVTCGMLCDSKVIIQELQTSGIGGFSVYKKNLNTLPVRQQLLEMQSRKLCSLKDILDHSRNAGYAPVLEIVAGSEDGLSVSDIASILQQRHASSIADYWKEKARKAIEFLLGLRLVDKMVNYDRSRVGEFYAISYLGMNVLNYKVANISTLATGVRGLAARFGRGGNGPP